MVELGSPTSTLGFENLRSPRQARRARRSYREESTTRSDEGAELEPWRVDFIREIEEHLDRQSV